MRIKEKIIAFFLTLWVIAPQIVHAGYKIGDAEGFVGNAAGRAGVEEREVTTIVGEGLKGAISLVGIFFFVLMIYGGFKWMTARGNEDKVTEARNTVIAAIIGAAVVVVAYAITTFVGRIAN